MVSSKEVIVKCPRCGDISNVSWWGKILLPYDSLDMDAEMICPKCMKMSFKGELIEVK